MLRLLSNSWTVPTLPENCSFDTDFDLYANANTPDLIISNDSVGFRCHKAILSKLSTFMKNCIEGDQDCEHIKLTDISDEGIVHLERLIYTICCDAIPKTSIKDIFQLYQKYDFKDLENDFLNMIDFEDLGKWWVELKRHGNYILASRISYRFSRELERNINFYSQTSETRQFESEEEIEKFILSFNRDLLKSALATELDYFKYYVVSQNQMLVYFISMKQGILTKESVCLMFKNISDETTRAIRKVSEESDVVYNVEESIKKNIKQIHTSASTGFSHRYLVDVCNVDFLKNIISDCRKDMEIICGVFEENGSINGSYESEMLYDNWLRVENFLQFIICLKTLKIEVGI